MAGMEQMSVQTAMIVMPRGMPLLMARNCAGKRVQKSAVTRAGRRNMMRSWATAIMRSHTVCWPVCPSTNCNSSAMSM